MASKLTAHVLRTRGFTTDDFEAKDYGDGNIHINWKIAAPPEEQIAAWVAEFEAREEKKIQRTATQDAGITFNGQVIPLHSEQASLLMKVAAGFQFGSYERTVIEFSDDLHVPVTRAEFPLLARQFSDAYNALFDAGEA